MPTDTQTASTDALGHRVGELTNRVGQMETNFDKLNSKIDGNQILVLDAINKVAQRNESTREEIARSQLEKQKVNWPVILTATGLLFTIGITTWGGIWSLLGGRIDDNRQRIERLIERADRIEAKFISREDLQMRFDAIKEDIERIRNTYVTKESIASAAARRDSEQASVAGRLERIESDMKDNRTAVVPRAEHNREWSTQAERDSRLQAQIDELKRDAGSLYGPRDELKRLQSRIDELERSGKVGVK